MFTETESYEAHLEYLAQVFDRLGEVNIRVKAKKRFFTMPKVKYLGHIITSDRKKHDERIGLIENEVPCDIEVSDPLWESLGILGNSSKLSTSSVWL